MQKMVKDIGIGITEFACLLPQTSVSQSSRYGYCLYFGIWLVAHFCTNFILHYISKGFILILALHVGTCL